MRKKIEIKTAWPAIEPEDMRGKYVGFWARVWGSFLDSLLIVMVTYPLLILSYGWTFLESRSLLEGPVHLVLSWMFPAVAIVVFWVTRSATPGKMAIGAKIVDATTGGKPSARQLVKRYVGYYLSALPLGWGFLHVAFDPRKQGWHDRWAGTVVVYQAPIKDQPQPAPMRRSLLHDAWEKDGPSGFVPSKF